MSRTRSLSVRTAMIRVVLPACVSLLAQACNSNHAGLQAANELKDAGQLMELKQQEAANVAHVRKCLNLVFTQKNIQQAKAECFGDVYIQHNPGIATGLDAMVAKVGKMLEDNPQMSLEIKRTGADKDLVWVHSHAKCTPDSAGLALVDIFRLKDTKIVEHWDVIQPVPATSLNDNSMF